ncbi:MAG: hypothetical protein JWN10_2519 [Solirubrobacterales bacterium]|nr:hypothetical protein [Solirubrobacterales bacterium]
MLAGAALAIAGCGAGPHATAPESRLERADLVVVARALSAEGPAVQSEVQATKAAWPLIIDGLPANIRKLPRTPLRIAGERASALRLPSVFEEHHAASLTGPATSLAGTFRNYYLLTGRGWRLIGAAIEQSERGPRAAASFARANVALYIESVYDAHFALAQIGKQMPIDYERLGGAAAFGSSLTPSEVDALARSYSEANDRLQPRARVRLGS